MEPHGKLFNNKPEEENGGLGDTIPSLNKGTEGCQDMSRQGEADF